MKLLLGVLKPIVWHNIKRFAGVLGVILILAGPAYVSYQQGYKQGYAIGSDKPTNVFNAPSEPKTYNSDPKDRPFLIGIKIFKLGLGIIWERK